MLNKKIILMLILFIILNINTKTSANEAGICGEVPLYLGRYAAPEILFIVDLSGSMAYGLRPDWTPVYSSSENYTGFYTDHGLKNYVFNRVPFYYNGYFEVYGCAPSINNISGPFLTNECYYYLNGVNLDNVYIDEILQEYGIADWSYHKYYNDPPYAEQFYGYYNCPYLYEEDTAVLGNYLNTMRIEVVGNVIKELVQDASLSVGLAFFKSSFGSRNNYTSIYEGIEPYSSEHINNIIQTIDNITHESITCQNSSAPCFRIYVSGGTPFSPSIIAAKKYFHHEKCDRKGHYYSPGQCAKKFAIFLTDGIGNIDSTVENVRCRTRDLVHSGVTPIAVGFNLPADEDEQLRAMAQVANEEADGENTFALHRDTDEDGIPDPFIARSPQELADTLRSIIYEIKQTVFKTGAGMARNTQMGNMIFWTNFDLTDWTGEIRTGYFNFNCANCHSPADVRLLARWNYFNDTDNDGHLDLVNEDKDGDGRLDTVFEDRDHDGHLDLDEDQNGNGKLDEGEDIDGDGHLDVDEDIDKDGHLDVPEDLDGDGHLDIAEEIDWTKLEEFLSDVNEIQEKMGQEAVKNYSSSKIGTIIQILREELPDKEWWEVEDGWSSSQTLTCDSASSRNIKYGTQMKDFIGAVSPLSSDEVKFIRGERGCGNDTEFRIRSKPLGDIIYSQPRVWNGLVWVTANDGMLHAFDINTGEERFAYIPQSILSRYQEINYFDIGYCHAFLFDGTPVINEVNGTSLLVVGLGRGGNEFIALDITNTEATGTANFKWSFSDSDLGETWNPAKFVKCGGSWKVILPSGYAEESDEWPNKKAYLFVVNTENGNLISKIALSNEGSNMPSPPSVVDLNSDNEMDILYVGDLKGKLRRFRGCNLSTNCTLLDLGSTHPITASPVATVSNGMTWVFLGTGKYWDINDLSDNTSQYLIGFFDNPSTCSSVSLTEIAITEKDNYLLPTGVCQPVEGGWKITLRPGERVITSPIVMGGTVFFLSFMHTGDECTGNGETWLYALDYNKGCSSTPKIDINDDGKVDSEDLVEGKVPLAIKVGSGVPSSEPVAISPNILRITTQDIQRNFIVTVKNVWIKPGSWTDVDILSP